MSEISVRFGYGVFCDSLEKQANDQGFNLKNSEMYEKIRHSINMCKFHVATESQVDSMLKKLHKKVIADLKPIK
jgi:hypothetical protein